MLKLKKNTERMTNGTQKNENYMKNYESHRNRIFVNKSDVYIFIFYENVRVCSLYLEPVSNVF